MTDGFTVRDDEDRTYRVRRREDGILAAAVKTLLEPYPSEPLRVETAGC